jgi:hypothetical protein
MTEKELLRGTLGRLRRGGWQPMEGIPGTSGPHCVLTALGTELGVQMHTPIPEFYKLVDDNPGYDAAVRRLRRLTGRDIIDWNDTRESFDEVETLILTAIAEIEVEEVTARAAAAAQQPEPAYA